MQVRTGGFVEPEELELGRLAYEAYCAATDWKSAVTGATLPPFYKTPEAVRIAWVAAAQAVKNEVQRRGDAV
jgi:hypothetical protein